MSHAHDAKYGPKTAHLRKQEELEMGNDQMQSGVEGPRESYEPALQQPAAAAHPQVHELAT